MFLVSPPTPCVDVPGSTTSLICKSRKHLLQVAWVYTVLVATSLGTLVGLTQRWMGTPGDLPDTIKNVHTRGYIPIKQAPSMFICSSFSISAGGFPSLIACA